MNDGAVSLLDERVNEVIAAYLEEERAGASPDSDELIERHPDLAGELEGFFSDRVRFAQLAELMIPRHHSVNRGSASVEAPATMASTIDAARYVDLRPHARGGLGEVFAATDTELHRRVALKRLQDRRADDGASQRRFLLEAEITAQLEHPGVVPVHSLYWDDQDRPCYTMRFVEGETLADAIQENHEGSPDLVAFRRLLQSFIQVCETVAYAHSRGVIHRDLKPQNIMIGKFGETLVVDWGLAKVVGREPIDQRDNLEQTLRPLGVSDSGNDRTQMGSAVGTPAYMSPEQAAGRWDVINAASDVYNLGAVLYAVLSGRAPVDGSNWPEMQQKIQRGDFPSPRAVKPTVTRPLEAVCLRAMAMKPEDRYPSARELAADVERWLADEPVSAYPEPVTTRLWRWMRRHKGAVGSGISACIAVVTIAVGTWIIVLEREIAKKEHHTRVAERASWWGQDVVIRDTKFDALVRTKLDQMAAQVGTGSPANPEKRKADKEFLGQLAALWDEAIRTDTDAQTGKPGWRSDVYRLQRALCLARLGDHQQAVQEAISVESASLAVGPWLKSGFDPDKRYDLARVYALCAALTIDKGRTTQEYVDRAMTHLRELAEAGYFKAEPRANRLRDDRDLQFLRPRDDFRKLLGEVQPKSI